MRGLDTGKRPCFSQMKRDKLGQNSPPDRHPFQPAVSCCFLSTVFCLCIFCLVHIWLFLSEKKDTSLNYSNKTVYTADNKQCTKQQATEWDLAPFVRIASGIASQCGQGLKGQTKEKSLRKLDHSFVKAFVKLSLCFEHCRGSVTVVTTTITPPTT